MDIKRNMLDEDTKPRIESLDKKISEIEASLDKLYVEFNAKKSELEKVKEKIRPIKQNLGELSELKAGLVNRRSRVKYFPEFATRNYDGSKDKQFLEFFDKKVKVK